MVAKEDIRIETRQIQWWFWILPVLFEGLFSCIVVDGGVHRGANDANNYSYQIEAQYIVQLLN
jgi:hypothetical protein